MKTFILGLTIGILLTMPIFVFSAGDLADRLQGKILLAVEDKGKTYYVYNGNRYRINSDSAHEVFKRLALGITNKDLKQIPIMDIGISSENIESSSELKQCLADKNKWENKFNIANTKFYEMGDVAQGWKDKYYKMDIIAKEWKDASNDWQEASEIYEEGYEQCRINFSEAVNIAQRCQDREQGYVNTINEWKDLYMNK